MKRKKKKKLDILQAINAFQRYAQHKMDCGWTKGAGKCSCGLWKQYTAMAEHTRGDGPLCIPKESSAETDTYQAVNRPRKARFHVKPTTKGSVKTRRTVRNLQLIWKPTISK